MTFKEQLSTKTSLNNLHRKILNDSCYSLYTDFYFRASILNFDMFYPRPPKTERRPWIGHININIFIPYGSRVDVILLTSSNI